jgi:hypothetical protein
VIRQCDAAPRKTPACAFRREFGDARASLGEARRQESFE